MHPSNAIDLTSLLPNIFETKSCYRAVEMNESPHHCSCSIAQQSETLDHLPLVA